MIEFQQQSLQFIKIDAKWGEMNCIETKLVD